MLRSISGVRVIVLAFVRFSVIPLSAFMIIYTVVTANDLRELGIESADKMDFYSLNNQKLT